ncbi:recombination protein NinB [Bradyrhizobium sp. 930_D9_N1_4]|uniref:recombination protein NinB n=1 Tax=Bradyrhizobium sp. 930_D9_N1_4 TaxID=3240374 RepID=UPI003F899A91
MPRAVVQIKGQADRNLIARWAMDAQNVPAGTTVEFRAPRRSLDQNALMWSLLGQISKAVDWYGQKLSSEDWKDVLTASLRRTRVVPGIDAGTFVPLGMRTSQMTKEEISDLLELIYAFGAERGVKFRELELVS